MIEEIFELINTQREGEYWDFKEKHHDNKANLLHDILCLANSLAKRDKFLIYGVSDPSDGCELKGVTEENRRSQTDLIDFLRSKDFAGGMRPEVELRSFTVDDNDIDVIRIFDHREKPYYITSDYRDKSRLVKANHIYSRTLDTNTPINENSDLNRIERMWRERFGLDLQPAQRMIELIKKPHQWDKDVGNRAYAYHKHHPEYQVKFGETSEFKDVYSYFYINEQSFIGTASFRYLSTELFTLPYVYCDEMRIEFACPRNGHVFSNGKEVWYMYYELDSKLGAFLHFLTNGSFDFNSRVSETAFTIFKNKKQRESFENFLGRNLDQLEKMNEDELGLMKRNRIEKSGENFLFDPVQMINIQRMFSNWEKGN